MAQKTQNTQPMPSETPSQADTEHAETESPIRGGTNLFTLARGTAGRDAQAKVAFMGDIRQKLAEVADLSRDQAELTKEGEQLAGSSATRLFLARKAGVISADELTGLLGDIFGYKPKADKTPGKAPAGVGEAMRKRIVRALQGVDFVNGGEGGRFYHTMAVSDVAPIINSIGRVKKNEKGETVDDGRTVWMAYKDLGDLKSQGTVRVDFAFDPKKIAGLVDKLSESGAREKLLNNPPLVKAYGALFDQLQIISQVDDNEAEAIAQRLNGGPGEEPEAEIETEVEEVEGEEVAA